VCWTQVERSKRELGAHLLSHFLVAQLQSPPLHRQLLALRLERRALRLKLRALRLKLLSSTIGGAGGRVSERFTCVFNVCGAQQPRTRPSFGRREKARASPGKATRSSPPRPSAAAGAPPLPRRQAPAGQAGKGGPPCVSGAPVCGACPGVTRRTSGRGTLPPPTPAQNVNPRPHLAVSFEPRALPFQRLRLRPRGIRRGPRGGLARLHLRGFTIQIRRFVVEPRALPGYLDGCLGHGLGLVLGLAHHKGSRRLCPHRRLRFFLRGWRWCVVTGCALASLADNLEASQQEHSGQNSNRWLLQARRPNPPPLRPLPGAHAPWPRARRPARPPPAPQHGARTPEPPRPSPR
jgi:hypothetical protein